MLIYFDLGLLHHVLVNFIFVDLLSTPSPLIFWKGPCLFQAAFPLVCCLMCPKSCQHPAPPAVEGTPKDKSQLACTPRQTPAPAKFLPTPPKVLLTLPAFVCPPPWKKELLIGSTGRAELLHPHYHGKLVLCKHRSAIRGSRGHPAHRLRAVENSRKFESHVLTSVLMPKACLQGGETHLISP